jgi:tetratricopeptide repeat protein 7
VQSLLLGAKLCYKNSVHAPEGMQMTIRALEFMRDEKIYNHLIGIAYHFLGCCLGHCARSLPNPEKSKLQHSALKVLLRSLELERHNPEMLCSLACENLMQRKPKAAVKFGKRFLDMVQGSLVDGWKLLVLAVSSQQQSKEAEEIVDFIIDEADGWTKLEYLKLKALLQISGGEFGAAIDTFGVLLARVKVLEELQISVSNTQVIYILSVIIKVFYVYLEKSHNVMDTLTLSCTYKELVSSSTTQRKSNSGSVSIF